jgi:hypothetical protein
MIQENAEMDKKASAELRDHIKRLTKHILDNNVDLSKPNSFEKASLLVKDSLLKFDPVKKTSAISREVSGSTSRIAKVNLNVGPMNLSARIEDLDEKFKNLSLAGRSISKFEILALKSSIVSIAHKHDVAEISYFGKLLGQFKDIHVISSLAKNASAKAQDVNMIDFFVSTDIENWIKLPSVTPTDFRNAQKWNKFWDFQMHSSLSDDEDVQKRLKSLLLRILFSNKVCPEGYLIPGEEEDSDPVRDPEFLFQTEKLETNEGWVHEMPYILKYGALNHKDYGTDEIKEKVETLDPAKERFSKIADEKRKWTVRIYDEKMPISFPDKENDLPSAQKVFILTNDLWPEAINFFDDYRKSFGFFYVGYGFKSQNSPLPKVFIPVEPEKVNDKLKEFKEPNPEDAALVFETDSEPEPTSDKDE